MRWLMILSLGATCALGARPAEACLNGVMMHTDEAVKRVAQARRAIDRGHYRKALRLVAADHYMFDSNRLSRQIRTVKAVASLRLGRTKTAERRLRRLLRGHQSDPYLRTRLAESIAGRTGHWAVEAFHILDELEKKDLIPDAHGFAALAKLRHRNKDSEGRDRAVAQCRKRARKKSMCPSFAVATTGS